MKKNLIGVVDKIKLLTLFPDMLLRFTLLVDEGKINCLVVNKEICHELLFLNNGENEVALFGHYNSRQQLIVEKLVIRQSKNRPHDLLERCGA
ncbi:MAG: hypothetical protein RR554_09700 [Vagococcus sp.]|uniref:hypothetical protein n=1 Tax=Vagococcus sp. TaxID=1933889 RepID=UPI002FCA3BD6